MKKAAAIVVIVGVLLVQAAAIVPPGSSYFGSWYWPFLDYPMYSAAHPAGAVVTIHELRGRPCGVVGRTSFAIGADDLGLPLHEYLRTLRLAGAPTSADPRQRSVAAELVQDRRDRLSRLSAERMPHVCELEVRERSARVGVGDDFHAAPWRRIHTWRVSETAGAQSERTEVEP
jgi:hypothetical protein